MRSLAQPSASPGGTAGAGQPVHAHRVQHPDGDESECSGVSLWTHPSGQPSRARQRRVQHFRPVCGGQQQHAGAALKTVELSQQLVERLVPLLVQTQAPLATWKWGRTVV